MNPEINALATLIFLGVVGIVGFIAWYLMARAEKQRIRDIQRARRAAEDTKICQPGYIMLRMSRHCFHGRRNVGIF